MSISDVVVHTIPENFKCQNGLTKDSFFLVGKLSKFIHSIFSLSETWLGIDFTI